ncbi:hypothetical protein [Romboutsia ilealis]|uniref:hypothetical protein n=1 Tax=Romboutsia ilealis TaxID=1115758 RepID=UPI00272A714B|nr:hypothetical protein [Romboutsia ilealis]
MSSSILTRSTEVTSASETKVVNATNMEEILLKANNIKYEPDAIDIIFKNGDIESIDAGFVTQIMIEKDYEEAYFPIISITLNIRPELYNRVVKEKETVKLRLGIRKNYYTKENKFIKYEKFLNEVFCFFLDDATPLLDKDSIEDMHKAQGETSPSDFKRVYTFYLFKEKELTSCKTIINDVLHGNMVDIVAYIIQKIGLNKILMTKPDNTTSVTNFLIPALNVIETFNYLEQKKGIYYKGLLLFFDFDCIYCIDKNYKCTAWRPNENKQTFINIFKKTSEYNATPGVYIDEKKKTSYIFTNSSSVDIASSSIITNQLDGNDALFITPSENKKTTYKHELPNRGGNNVKIYVSEDSNKFFTEAESVRLMESNCVLNVSFIDTDLSALTPNKEFVIKFEETDVNKEYGGKYRLSKYLAIFKKEGNEFSLLSNCELRRQSIN